MDTTPRWTDQDLTLAWHTGRDYQQRLIDEAADDITHATHRPPTLTYEQRVTARLADMQRTIAPDEYLGGPVPWDGNRALPAGVADAARRHRHHDQTTLEVALRHRPAYAADDWPGVHAAVSAAVWWRIWWDLADATRARHADLAPITAPQLAGEAA